MRFDGTPAPKPNYADVPASMRPVPLPPGYTPFPLPKHAGDDSFQPTRLPDAPDLVAARRRVASAATALAQPDDHAAELAALEAAAGARAAAFAEPPALSMHDALAAARGGPRDQLYLETAEPHVTKLVCVRELQDLFEQALEPDNIRRYSAFADITARVPDMTADELVATFSVIAETRPPGTPLFFPLFFSGKNFEQVIVDQRALAAYMDFFHTVEEHLCERAPGMVRDHPAVLVRLLQLMAHVQLLDTKGVVEDFGMNSGMDQFLARCHDRVRSSTFPGHRALALAETALGDRSFVATLAPAQLADAVAAVASLFASRTAGETAPRALVEPLLAAYRSAATATAAADAVTASRMWFAAVTANANDVVIRDAALAAPPTMYTMLALSRAAGVDGTAAADSVAAYAADPAVYEAVAEMSALCTALASLRDRDVAQRIAAEAEVTHRIMGALAARYPWPTQEALAAADDDATHVSLWHDTASAAPADSEQLNMENVERFGAALRRARGDEFAEFVYVHPSTPSRGSGAVIEAIQRCEPGRCLLIVSVAALLDMAELAESQDDAAADYGRAVQLLLFELDCGRAVLVTVADQLEMQRAGYATADMTMLDIVAAGLAHAPLVRPVVSIGLDNTMRVHRDFGGGVGPRDRFSGEYSEKSEPWQASPTQRRATTQDRLGVALTQIHYLDNRTSTRLSDLQDRRGGKYDPRCVGGNRHEKWGMLNTRSFYDKAMRRAGNVEIMRGVSHNASNANWAFTGVFTPASPMRVQ